MQHQEFRLRTADGEAEAHAYFPDGPGPFPPVIVYMDALSLRPAMHDLARRVAAGGYYVLLPDIFYRIPDWKNKDAKKVFADPDLRAEVMTRVMPSANAANAMRDTEAWIAHVDAQKNVEHDGIAVTGYCMGGRLAITAAGTFPDRITAAAAYHPGGLATDAPESPHRLAPRIKAMLYIGGARDDNSFDDAQKERLAKALDDAHVRYTLETYDAMHGWVPTDTPAHDEAAAERAFASLSRLLEANAS